MKRTQILNLGKHFSIVDSPVPFYLIDNYGFRAYRPSGAWQFDNWKLLPEKFHKNYPVYTLSIEWDSGVNDDLNPTFTDTDLDLGDGIAGVSGQPVNITTPVTVSNLPNVNVGDQICVPVHVKTGLEPLEVVSHAFNVIDGFKFGNEFYIEKSIYIKKGLIVQMPSSSKPSEWIWFYVEDCLVYIKYDEASGGSFYFLGRGCMGSGGPQNIDGLELKSVARSFGLGQKVLAKYCFYKELD